MQLLNDDQTVPDFSGQSNGLPALDRLNSFSTLPDFSTLFDSINTPSATIVNDIFSFTEEQASRGFDTPDCGSALIQERNFYEDFGKVKVKTEELDTYPPQVLAPAQLLQQPDVKPVFSSQISLAASEVAFQDTRNKIDLGCLELDIPRDPKEWSAAHVQKWITWIFRQYNIHITVDLPINGPMLCNISPDGMRHLTQSNPEFGVILTVEFEAWKNVISIEATQRQPPTYADISHSRAERPTDIDIPVPRPLCPSMTLNQLNYDVSEASSVYQPLLSGQHVFNQVTLDTSPTNSLSSGLGSLFEDSSESGFFSDPAEEPVQRPRKIKRPLAGHTKHTIHLWQFLRDLLLQPASFQDCIRWLDREKGIFKIEDSSRVAKLWGQKKNRPAMNYDKLSRSIRQYYKKGIIKKTEQSKRLIYQFCPKYQPQ